MSEGKMTQTSPRLSLQDQIDLIPGSKWVEKVRFAFNECYKEHTEGLSCEQFIHSRLRFLITDHEMNKSEMSNLFEKIDANLSGRLGWKELTDYLLTHVNSLDKFSLDSEMKLSFLKPEDFMHRPTYRTIKNLRILELRGQELIVSLAETSLTFWNIDSCDMVFSISGGPFVDCCLVSSMSKIAVVKSNRQIEFYDIRSFKKMDFVMSASISRDVSKLTESESKRAVISGNIRAAAMFSTTTAIAADAHDNILFLGNEEGEIEVFALKASGRSRFGWMYERIAMCKFHTAVITQITYLSREKHYVSSSMDGSFVSWRFDGTKLHTIFHFMNTERLGILSFAYDQVTRDIVYITNAHYYGVWRTGTNNYICKESGTSMLLAVETTSLSTSSSFCIMVSQDNRVIISRMPNIEEVGSYYIGLQHGLCTPTAALCSGKFLYLAGALMSKWMCYDGTGENMVAHDAPIVRAIASELFDRVLSIDRNGELKAWNPNNGIETFSGRTTPNCDPVLCIEPDQTGKRLVIGHASGTVDVIGTTSCTLFTSIDKSMFEGGCSALALGPILRQFRIICASGKACFMFDDVSGNRIRFVRSFLGHSQNISFIVIAKQRFVLSVGETELFLWNIQRQTPAMKYELPAEPSALVDLPDDPQRFLVGDAEGNIQVMSLENERPLECFKGIGTTIVSPLTRMCVGGDVLIVANMHGYVKTYTIKKNGFEEMLRWRAHEDAVTSLSFFQGTGCLVTVGRYQEMKLWKLNPFALVGQFGTNIKWNITEPTTYLSGEGLPDVPEHFASPDLRKRVTTEPKQAQIEAMIKRQASRRVILKQLSFDEEQELFDGMEEQCETGRKNLEDVQPKKHEKVKKKIPTPRSTADMISQETLDETLRRVQALRGD